MKRPLLLPVCTLCALYFCLVGDATGDEPERVIFDFESGDLQGWRVVEGEFERPIGSREFFFNHPTRKYNKQGTCYLNTLELDSGKPTGAMTGVIESPVFVLSAGSISLLVGGGAHANTYVALCTVHGEEILFGRGKNIETLQRVTWDASRLVGKEVFLRIVDRHPGSWGYVSFDDFSADGRIDAEATRRRVALRRRARQEETRRAFLASAESLRRAILDLMDTHGDGYARGKEFLARLDGFTSLGAETTGPEPEELTARLEALRRQALVANPLVSGQPILFVVRRQYRNDHHNTATMFQTGEINTQSFDGGGAMKTIDFARGGRVTTLVELPEGVVRDPELHFDGQKVLFSMRKSVEDEYHLYEINTDGTELKQLTFGPGISDIDPIYLPDEGIVFSSTREPKYCMCNRHVMANLFRMDADGANIHQISKNTLHDGHGSLTPDGRILYDRWEYVDREQLSAQGLWTVNPDGTGLNVYYGNNTYSPGAVLDARVIPGTRQVLCIFGACHDRPWGAMTILDRRLGVDGRPAVVRTWPAEAVDLVDVGNQDTFKKANPKYEDPYPLGEKYFLSARMTGQDDRTGIYLVDVFGNEILLHAEAPGCFDPMPLGPRPRPPVIPWRRDFESEEGTFFVVDVYEGTHMQGVRRGSVKYLRVIESPEKRGWTLSGWWQPAGPAVNWHDFDNKRILGTVPVEEDGSAHFIVPTGKFVFFQLLDENRMMIHSMRSGTTVQPGERVGCVGCHDHRQRAPIRMGGKPPAALRRPPNSLDGWYGPPRLFSYMTEVQPVFDKFCVSCHDYGKDAGEKLNLAADRSVTFNASYNDLWTKMWSKEKTLGALGAGAPPIQQAYDWGSHRSKLIEIVRNGHEDVRIDRESLDRLVTWIDLNGPYYPVHLSAYPDSQAGRSPLDYAELDRLSELTGVPFREIANFATSRGPQVSFDRPELSPCLKKFPDKTAPGYLEALAIIQSGKKMLAERPRADMPDFQPCAMDHHRLEKYDLLQQEQSKVWKAIASGGKYRGTRDSRPTIGDQAR